MSLQKQLCRISIILMGLMLPLVPQSSIAQQLELIQHDVVTIGSTIPYADGVGSELIRSECNWNTVMPALMVIQSRHTLASTEEDLAKVTGKKLFIKTSDIHVIGGSNFSGPKWIVLQGELVDNGKLLGNFEFKRMTMGGKFTACKTLDYISESLIKDILKWLKKPGMMPSPKSGQK